MKKNNVELTSKILTVEDAINVLLTIPKNYTLNTVPFVICIEHGLKEIGVLEATDAEDFVKAVKADLKSVGEPFEIDVPDEDLLTCEDDVYRKLWAAHVKQDVEDYSKDNGIVLEDAAIEEVARRYVYEGEYDHNFSYWINIENLIQNVRRKSL